MLVDGLTVGDDDDGSGRDDLNGGSSLRGAALILGVCVAGWLALNECSLRLS